MEAAPAYDPALVRQNLAYALGKLHRDDEAAKLYEELLALPAANHTPDLYENAAFNAYQRGDAREAARIATLGTKRFPADPWIWEQLGWSLFRVHDAVGPGQAIELSGFPPPRYDLVTIAQRP